MLGQGFDASDAPRMDFFLTVCDKATGEVCPVWHGQPLSAHGVGWTTPPVA
jgi:arsenate reductase